LKCSQLYNRVGKWVLTGHKWTISRLRPRTRTPDVASQGPWFLHVPVHAERTVLDRMLIIGSRISTCGPDITTMEQQAQNPLLLSNYCQHTKVARQGSSSPGLICLRRHGLLALLLAGLAFLTTTSTTTTITTTTTTTASLV
jgi:hypothetical protein